MEVGGEVGGGEVGASIRLNNFSQDTGMGGTGGGGVGGRGGGWSANQTGQVGGVKVVSEQTLKN